VRDVKEIILTKGRYVKKILEIPVLSKSGAKQLDTDISIYFILIFYCYSLDIFFSF
jgi:hypothetical protein